jgi:hypothetical protein
VKFPPFISVGGGEREREREKERERERGGEKFSREYFCLWVFI